MKVNKFLNYTEIHYNYPECVDVLNISINISKRSSAPNIRKTSITHNEALQILLSSISVPIAQINQRFVRHTWRQLTHYTSYKSTRAPRAQKEKASNKQAYT